MVKNFLPCSFFGLQVFCSKSFPLANFLGCQWLFFVAVPMQEDLLAFPVIAESVVSPWYGLLYAVGKHRLLAARNTFLRALISALHDMKGE